jgi:K+-sensing histidine kinase KdpD
MKEEPKADFSLILASSVHDMKNSLGMLLNSLESVMQETPAENEAQEKRFATLQYEASRINTELIQLLSIYRMENDRLPVQVDEHYLIDILEEQVARNDMLFQTRNLAVEVDCDEDLLWYFDAELIGGVIHNILVNGARYSHSKMKVKAEVLNDELIVTVSDDGGGYPSFMLGSPQQSFAKSVSFSEGNTHLGLYFAQESARLHSRNQREGRIELSNGGDLGGGVFTISLP